MARLQTVNSLNNRLTIRLEVVPGKTVIERVEFAAQCGFDGIAFPGRLMERFGDETLSSLSNLALPIKTVSLGFEGSLCSPSDSSRRGCRDSIVALFDFCNAVGASSLNMPPVLNQDNVDRFPLDAIDQQDRLLIEQLPELGGEAEKRNVKLLIEPVNRFETDYLRTVSHATRICSAVNHPAIGLTPDFFHMQLEELDTAAALRAAAKWIRHVHTAENTRVEPGPGQLDLRPGFRALQEAGYAGLVEVECRSLSGPAADVLPRSAAYLKSEWAAASDSLG